jgi:hypothetical protein
MKTLVLYYSYSGHTKKLAEAIAKKDAADIAEIKDVTRPNVFGAYAKGGMLAIKGGEWPVQPLGVDLATYDRIVLMSAVWAGNPTPAVNSVLADFPSGKTVSVKMVSGSGHSKCKENVETIIIAKGCVMESFEDIKG